MEYKKNSVANLKYPMCQNDIMHKPYIERSYPIAECIVEIIASKKVSYVEACEALDIAKKGIEMLTLTI